MSSVITLGDNCWVLSLSKELASLESMSRIIYGIPLSEDWVVTQPIDFITAFFHVE